MQESRRADYASRIERAIALLEARAGGGDPPSLAELASVAALSEFHFHRVFRLMTGESPGAAIQRVRLGHSLSGLSQGIAEATGRSGYATSQAYARALRAGAGASPGELRSDAEKREALAARLARPAHDGEDVALTIEVASFEPLRLLTLRNVGAYAELNSGYGRLFELLMEQVGPEAIEGIYGLPHDDPRHADPASCRFTCAFDTGTSGEAQGDVGEAVLPGGRYAMLALRGDFDLVHDALDGLYAWAIASDEAIADAPLFIHYLDDPDEVPPPDQRAVACLPLEGEGQP